MKCEFCPAQLVRKTGERPQDFRARRFCGRSCASRSKRKPINHGTVSGYNVHLKRGERPKEVCSECHEARLAWQRARHPEVMRRDVTKAKARRRATVALIGAHHEEYELLYKQEYERLEGEAA